VTTSQPQRGAARAGRIYDVMLVAGFVTVVGWLWALWFALMPINVGDTGTTVSCGPPALYDANAGGDACTTRVDAHIRGAVGVSVVTLPTSALWLWLACVFRFRGTVGQKTTSTTGSPSPSQGT
jgi:hypothetical protein